MEGGRVEGEGNSQIKGEIIFSASVRENTVHIFVKCVISLLLELVLVTLQSPLSEMYVRKALVRSGLMSFLLFCGAWYFVCPMIMIRVVNVRALLCVSLFILLSALCHSLVESVTGCPTYSTKTAFMKSVNHRPRTNISHMQTVWMSKGGVGNTKALHFTSSLFI